MKYNILINYVEKIMAYADTPFVKILSGIRRSGKSTILKMIVEALHARGITTIFYVADPALRYSVLGYSPDSVAAMLENVVYLELLRRGYEVTIGQLSDGEIDFVATRSGDKLYV